MFSSCLRTLLLTSSSSAVGGGVKILFENELGVADFHLSNKSCILYVSECDIIAGTSYKRKLVRYRNVSLKETTILLTFLPLCGPLT